jgi:glycosyltransferase involved in cell wall biosynthesis
VRIVQIVESLKVGGLEKMSVDLAVTHRKAGHFSAIYTVFDPGPLAAEASAGGVSVVPFHKAIGFRPGTIFAMAKRLRSDGAQVVHTHNSGIHHYGVLAGRLAGVKVIVNTRHGLALHSGQRQEVYYRTTMPLTSAVVFVCDNGRRHFTELGAVPPKKGRVILNGIPVEKFGCLRASPGSARPKIRFGTIGRFVKAKAHGDLVAAFALLAPQLPQAELHIWGYGELEGRLLEDIAARGLEGRIYYRGMTSNTPEALREMDAFVLSSISEGLPLVILEAMAAGLPVVSTRVGGVPEVAPEGIVAWYSRCGDPQDLAAAMRAAASADLAAAGEAAYRLAAGRFSLETMQAHYAALFEELLVPGRKTG